MMIWDSNLCDFGAAPLPPSIMETPRNAGFSQWFHKEWGGFGNISQWKWFQTQTRGKNNLTQTLLDQEIPTIYSRFGGWKEKYCIQGGNFTPWKQNTVIRLYHVAFSELCANHSGVHWFSSPCFHSIPNFLVMSGYAALLVIAFVVMLYAFRLDNNSKNHTNYKFWK